MSAAASRASKRTRRARGGLFASAALAALGVCAAGCQKKPKFYDAQVEITRMDPVRVDRASKKVLTSDLEFKYSECPGSQLEVVRGGTEFTECVARYKVGDKVPVKIEYHYDPHGFYDWDIYEVGGCKRPPDPEDEASFDTVQECEPLMVNGLESGFRCNRIPQKALLKKCHWFARH